MLCRTETIVCVTENMVARLPIKIGGIDNYNRQISPINFSSTSEVDELSLNLLYCILYADSFPSNDINKHILHVAHTELVGILNLSEAAYTVHILECIVFSIFCCGKLMACHFYSNDVG